MKLDTSKLSDNFSDSELGVQDAEQRIIENAKFICVTLLEPIRSRYNAPLRVHDGYRDPGHNSRVGGKPTSWHLFIGSQSAADFDVLGIDLRSSFDWIRLESKLPFDKCILETDSSGIPRCIHIQVSRSETPRRLAYIGNVGAGTAYVPVQVI